MSLWTSIKDAATLRRNEEEHLYAAALDEFESGVRRRGLWAKALVLSGGENAGTQAAYLKLVVQAMRDDAYMVERSAQKIAEAEKAGERVCPNCSSAASFTRRASPFAPGGVLTCDRCNHSVA